MHKTVLLLCLLLAACKLAGSNPSLASISVSPASASLGIGETQSFTATAKDTAGNTMSGVSFTWASSDGNKASVNSSGKAEGKAVGTAEITASANSLTSNKATLTVKASGGGGPTTIKSWVYQLQNYPGGKLDALIAAPFDLAVIDLARYANNDYFSAQEIGALKTSGKKVLSYFEIGSIENFRPEWPIIDVQNPDLKLNQWPTWPQEYFVKYWDQRWWNLVIKPRVDQALAAGFDGIYMDTPLAYFEIDLALVPGETRETLARKMVDLIMRISQYAKGKKSDFWIFPQNSPELREYAGYTEAIDGIGMEELFYLNADDPCNKEWCPENLKHTQALKKAGKMVLAVDYALQSANITDACNKGKAEGFIEYVTHVNLDRISQPCP